MLYGARDGYCPSLQLAHMPCSGNEGPHPRCRDRMPRGLISSYKYKCVRSLSSIQCSCNCCLPMRRAPPVRLPLLHRTDEEAVDAGASQMM